MDVDNLRRPLPPIANPSRYQHNVVFIGQWTEKKANLFPMLREARPFGLVIYGFGWKHTEFADVYNGVLPVNDLFQVYWRSKVAIGCTDDLQKSYGMVNNRVFEVLATQAILLTDHFPELEELFPESDQVKYYRRPGDVTRHLTEIFDNPASACATCGSGETVKRHTYSHRANDLDSFLQGGTWVNGRRNAMSLCVVFFKPAEIPFASFDSGFVKAISLLADVFHYRITWVNLADYATNQNTTEGHSFSLNEPITIDLDVDKIFKRDPYDIIIVKSNWYWYPDTFARTYLRQVNSRLILAISGVAPPPSLPEMEVYDALLSETKWYMSQLTAHSNVLHAFGVDTSTMIAQPSVSKLYDVLGIGNIVGYKRPELLGTDAHPDVSARKAWIGSVVDDSLAQLLQSKGVEILQPVSPADLAKVINQARKVHIPSALEGGGERAVLEAKACGVEVEVEADNPKLQELAELPRVWSHRYYAQQIQLAITRIVAFGPAKAGISLHFPSNNVHFPAKADVRAWLMPVRKVITDFNMGVDGFWTTHTTCFGVEYKVEIADFRVSAYIYLPVAPRTYECTFFVSLRPNVFAGIIKRTPDVTISVQGNPDVAHMPSADATCVNMSRIDCQSVLARKNPYDKIQEVVLPEMPEARVVNLDENPRLELVLADPAARELWATKETFDETASAVLRVGPFEVSVRFGLWGQGGLSLNNTTWRSVVVRPVEHAVFQLGGIKLERVVMLSLFEDEHKLSYMSGIHAFQSVTVHAQPLWKPATGTALLRVGQETSIYLLNEHPYDTAVRFQGVAIGQRDLDDGIVEVTSSSFKARVGDVHETYIELMENGQLRELEQGLDVEEYLHWLAVNNILMNGDYIDEVFFYTTQVQGLQYLRLIPWDLDTIFQPCHMQGRRAIRDDTLFYCAESRLDKFIQASPGLRYKLQNITRHLLTNVLTPFAYCSSHLRSALDNHRRLMKLSNVQEIQLLKGFNKLCAGFERRHEMLSASLFDAKVRLQKEETPNVVHRNNPHGEAEAGLPPWKPFVDIGGAEIIGVSITAPRSWPFADIPDVPVVLRWRQSGPIYQDVQLSVTCTEGTVQAKTLRKRYGMTGTTTTCRSFEVDSSSIPPIVTTIVDEAKTNWMPLCTTTSPHPVQTNWPPNSRILVPRTGCIVHNASIDISAGSVFLMEHLSSLTFKNATVTLNGTREAPIVVTGRSAAEPYGGWSVIGADGKILAAHTIFLRSGGGKVEGKQKGNQAYTHRLERAAMEVYDGAVLEMVAVALYAGRGQAFSAVNGKVNVLESLVQGFVAGGEFADTVLTVNKSVFTEFPDDDLGVYADEDNDAVYITGGETLLARSAFGYAKDDCLDSGSGEGGRLTIQDSLFDSCHHEGVAITNRGAAAKEVLILDSVLRNNQQGFELGWSTARLNVFISQSLFMHNQVGLRYGDNYLAEVNGFVHIRNCSFVGDYQKHVLRQLRNGQHTASTHLQLDVNFSSKNTGWKAPVKIAEDVGAVKKYPLSLLLEGVLVNFTYIVGEDLGELSRKLCAQVNRSCSDQMYSYLYLLARAKEREENGDDSAMLSIPINLGNSGEDAAFILYCNEDILMQVFHFCQSRALGYACTQRLLQESRRRMNQLSAVCGGKSDEASAPVPCAQKGAFVESIAWTGLTRTLSSLVLPRYPVFSVVEHGSKCHRSASVATSFGENVSVVCAGSDESILKLESLRTFTRCEAISLNHMFRAPDMVHVQVCLEDCCFKRVPAELNKLFSLSIFTVIDFGVEGTSGDVLDLLHKAANIETNRLKLRAFQVTDALGIWAIETIAMQRKVQHHYMAREEDGWVGSRYKVRVEDGEVQARRIRDGKVIPYRYLGYSLNTLLEAGLQTSSRKQLLDQFTELAVTEDMAPWNILFTNGTGLVYVDSETRLTSNLNPNYMLSLILLRGCHHLRSIFRDDPVAAFQQCMSYSMK